jgi:hypothetical protein
MSKKPRVVHEVIVPDNTFAIFFYYDEESKTVEIYLGDFATQEMQKTKNYDTLCLIAASIEELLGEVIQNALNVIGEDAKVDGNSKVVDVKGNVYKVNFIHNSSEEVH